MDLLVMNESNDLVRCIGYKGVGLEARHRVEDGGTRPTDGIKGADCLRKRMSRKKVWI